MGYRCALTTRKTQARRAAPFVSPKATGQSEAAFGEVFEGRNIPRDADGAWTCETRSKALLVRAAPMAHTVPCVGFVVVEPDRPGALDVDKVAPILERNIDALKAKGIKEPRRLYRVIKEMGADQQFTFPDGAVIRRDDVVGPDKRGRVLVFCGDTADASSLLPLVTIKGADVVVHEATNCRVEPFDNDVTEDEVERSSVSHGHSTPQLAGRFAALAGAERLVLNHFSPRYKGDASPAALAVMAKLEDAARSTFGGEVVAAWDLLNCRWRPRTRRPPPLLLPMRRGSRPAPTPPMRLNAASIAAPPPRKKAPPRLKKKPQAPSASKVR